MSEFKLPTIKGNDLTSLTSSISNYLYQLVEQLNQTTLALSKDITETSEKIITSNPTTTTEKEKQQESFDAIKGLIIKSADIVRAYYESMKLKFSGEYLAGGSLGTFVQNTVTGIDISDDGLMTYSQRDQTVTVNDVATKQTVISKIRQSPETIKIQANKIALEGYTTINEGFSIDLNGNMSCNNADIKGDITVGGADGTFGSITVEDENDSVIGEWKNDGISIYDGASSITSGSKLSVYNTKTSPSRYGMMSSYGLNVVSSSSVYTATRTASDALELVWGRPSTGFIGYVATLTSRTGNGVLYLGTPSATKITLDGSDGSEILSGHLIVNGTQGTAVSQELYVAGSGYATGGFSGGSAREFKENINPYTESAIDKINEIEIVSFNFKDDESKETKVGFIADDTNELFATKNHNAIDYNNCIGMLLKATQELSAKVEILETQVKTLQGGI